MKRVMVALTLVVALATAGCRTDHLAFRADDSLSIQFPTPQQRVRLPVNVAWRATGVRPGHTLTGNGPFFAVFLDRAPIAAGSSLKSLVDDDCRKARACPSLGWFADRHVYITGDTSLKLTAVPDASTGTRTEADDTQRIVVVRISPDGVRLDDTAASVEFAVVRA
jgi:hypothetical protein